MKSGEDTRPMGVSLIDILPNLKDWDAYESLPNRSRIVVSTQIASNNNGLRLLLQRTMPCPFVPRGTTVCGGIVCDRDSGISLCQRLNSLSGLTSGTCPQKGLTACAITVASSSLWTQSVIRLRRSDKSFSLRFYRGMAL